MPEVREVPRLRREPGAMRRIRRRHQRERPAERVDDFVEVPVVAPDPLGAPLP
jgi:hypothetical protein